MYFLGYPYCTKGYRVYDLDTGKIFISRDDLFYENTIPFPSSATDYSLPLLKTQPIIYDDVILSQPTNCEQPLLVELASSPSPHQLLPTPRLRSPSTPVPGLESSPTLASPPSTTTPPQLRRTTNAPSYL